MSIKISVAHYNPAYQALSPRGLCATSTKLVTLNSLWPTSRNVRGQPYARTYLGSGYRLHHTLGPDRRNLAWRPPHAKQENGNSNSSDGQFRFNPREPQPFPPKAHQPQPSVPPLFDKWQGKLLYRYYNWRQDSWSDLQLFTLINFAVVFIAAATRTMLIDLFNDIHGTSRGNDLWDNFYSVVVIVLGQEFPTESSWGEQVFNLTTAFAGVLSFALILAIMEQVVLQSFEANVKNGSLVYESGHVLVLAFGRCFKDVELLDNFLLQACFAYRTEGGKTVVVLSQRPKLEMEGLFRETLPEDKRSGTRFVFRQGSPLDKAELSRVAAKKAGVVVVVSDNSKSPEMADAQALRIAVLLDELYAQSSGQPVQVYVETRTLKSCNVIRMSCRSYITPVPTTFINAYRLTKLVQQPVAAVITESNWNFTSLSKSYIDYYPELVGCTFTEAALRLPDCSVYGIIDTATNKCTLTPRPDTILQPTDKLVLIRPTAYGSRGAPVMKKPADAEIGDWDSGSCSLAEDSIDLEYEEDFLAIAMSPRPMSIHSELRIADGLFSFSIPAFYKQKLLVLGWGESAFVKHMLTCLHRGPTALTQGSEIVLVNNHAPLEMTRLMERCESWQSGVSMRYVSADPLDIDALRRHIDITEFNSAVVLCDGSWSHRSAVSVSGEWGLVDKGEVADATQDDTMALDSMLLAVQLHLRVMMEEAKHWQMHIVCQQMSAERATRFEDNRKLPLGVSVNVPHYPARVLFQMAYDPLMQIVLDQLFTGIDLFTEDVHNFSAHGENISYWQLMLRVQSVGRVLMGWYEMPASAAEPIKVMLNPAAHLRADPRVWNDGTDKVKLLSIYKPPTIIRREDADPQPPSDTHPVVKGVSSWESVAGGTRSMDSNGA